MDAESDVYLHMTNTLNSISCFRLSKSMYWLPTCNLNIRNPANGGSMPVCCIAVVLSDIWMIILGVNHAQKEQLSVIQ